MFIRRNTGDSFMAITCTLEYVVKLTQQGKMAQPCGLSAPVGGQECLCPAPPSQSHTSPPHLGVQRFACLHSPGASVQARAQLI